MIDVTAFLTPYQGGRVRRPVNLVERPGSFPLELTPDDSWLAVTFRAFAGIAGRSDTRRVLIVGTGNGLDVLGAIEILDPDAVMATDVLPTSVEVARENVLAHLADPGAIALDFRVGDLLTCLPQDEPFGLIYENLPNIRATRDARLDTGLLAGRFFRAPELTVPERFEVALLALHHECLRQARPRIRPGGGVLTALGGRMPLGVAFDLHTSCGYAPELVAFDVKLQSEPELVVPGYADAERDYGVEFTFYAARAVEVAAEARSAGLEGEALYDAVQSELARDAMTAAEGLRRVRRGEPIAHSILMVLGVAR